MADTQFYIDMKEHYEDVQSHISHVLTKFPYSWEYEELRRLLDRQSKNAQAIVLEVDIILARPDQ